MDVREKLPSEKRLIDADALLKAIRTDYFEHFTQYHDTDQIALIDMVCDDIEESPTVDAVEVVRCRECKHRSTEDCPMYFHSSYWHEGYEEYVDDDTDHTEDDYFCQEVERKEGTD